MRKQLLLPVVVLLLLFAVVVAVSAQDATGTATPVARSGVEITYPPAISQVHGVIDVVGTANVPGMAFYRVEAIGLNSDLTVPENAAWIPLTTDITNTVSAGVLATIDTTSLPDGLYNLRVSAFTGSIDEPGQEYDGTAGPVRVDNESAPVTPPATETPEPTEMPDPTPAPTPTTPIVSPASGVAAVNIRRCDSTDNNGCPVIGSLPAGSSAALVGFSSSGSGWFYVQTSSGLLGWVSPTVAIAAGNTANLPSVAPPAPLPPAPPPPAPPPYVPPAPPPSYGNVIPNGIAVVGGTPVCNVPFTVQINMANTGGTSSAPGAVTLQDFHVDSGQITFTGYGNYPSLDPGANYVVSVPVVLTTYINSKHELRATNNGQEVSTRFTLQGGNCGGPPPPTPTPKPSHNQYHFSPGQCTLKRQGSGSPYYNDPAGNKSGQLPDGKFEAVQGQRINGERWYMIFINPSAAVAPVWVRQRDVKTSGDACKQF